MKEHDDLANEFAALKPNEAFRLTDYAQRVIIDALRSQPTRDMDILSMLILTSPENATPMKISSEPEKQTDNSIRFTVTAEDGEKWGVVVGMTKLSDSH